MQKRLITQNKPGFDPHLMRNLIAACPVFSCFSRLVRAGLVVMLATSSLFGQERAFVIASYPRNGAAGLPCSPVLSIQIYFPAESKTLDPLTLHDNNIRLYRANADEPPLRAELLFKPETNTLSIIPQSNLQPFNEYILSITPGLVDDRGFSLRPFFIRFTTASCDGEPAPLVSRGDPELPEVPPGPHVLLKSDSIIVMEEVNRLKWVTFGERMISSYLIRRKTDTADFARVADMVCPGDNDSSQSYVWIDPIPSHGWNHYQISAITILGDTLILDTISHFRKLVAFPNTDAIWQGRLPVVTWLPERTPMVAIIRDLDNDIVRKQAGWAEAGEKFWTVDLGVLDPGEYRVQVFLGTDSYSTDILVTE